jgi:hypothetical protein
MKDETRLWLSCAEERDLFDSIYIPSKGPVFGVLPEQFADWSGTA